MLKKIAINVTLCLACFAMLYKGAAITAQQFNSVSQHQQAFQQTSQAPSAKELAAVAVLVKTIDFLHSEKGKEAWPGYDLSTSPLVISFENGHLYAFNLKSDNAAWQTIFAAGKSVKYSVEDPWGASKVQMHPGFMIDGQAAFVFRFDLFQRGPSFLPFLILVHECFHQHQFGHFAIDEKALEGYQDHLNGENLALMQLEEILLVDFLKSEGDQKREALKDFTAINKLREGMLQPASLLWERNQQRMEGLADYVSMKTFAIANILPEFNDHAHLLATMQMTAHDDNVSERAIKRRHYGIGATLAYALDYLQVSDWKQQVERQGKGLDELLQQAVNLSEAESAERALQAKATHHFDHIQTKAVAALQEYQDEIADSMQAYQEIQGVEIILQIPPGVHVSGGGSNSDMYYLADGSTLFVNNNSVSTTTDSLWRLTLKDAPFLLQNKAGEKQFKVEHDLDIVLDQKTYHLSEIFSGGEEKKFTTLSCKGKFGMFQSEQHPGVICIENGKLRIKFS